MDLSALPLSHQQPKALLSVISFLEFWLTTDWSIIVLCVAWREFLVDKRLKATPIAVICHVIHGTASSIGPLILHF
jgi:hypothetical protein